jgi:hypothetical protein
MDWWNQVLNSFEYVWNSIVKFVYEQPFIFVIILIIALWSSISQIFKVRLKKKYVEPYEWSWNTVNREFYIKYYKKVQYIELFWAIFLILLMFIYLLTKDKIIWAVWAVWVWWFLITFQTFSVSLLTYFLLIRNYKIWDCISVVINWEKIQWQILFVKLLHLWLSWKNDFWENTGKFYSIPNYQLWNNPIIKVDLSLDNNAKDSLTIIYDPKVYNISFKEFSNELKTYLNTLFPVKSASETGYFISYIWVKYKRDVSYNSDWRATIRIWFVEKRTKAKEIKEKIICFVEDKKKTE